MIPVEFEQNNQNSSGIKKNRSLRDTRRPCRAGRFAPGFLVLLFPRVLRHLVLLFSCLLRQHWTRAECLCPLAEERGPVHIGITDTTVATGAHRAGIATMVTAAQQ